MEKGGSEGGGVSKKFIPKRSVLLAIQMIPHLATLMSLIIGGVITGGGRVSNRPFSAPKIIKWLFWGLKMLRRGESDVFMTI